MEVQIPWLGIILAAAAAMLIGTIWYSPAMFGKPWQRIVGLTDKKMKERTTSAMLILVLISLLTAYILAHFINYTHYFMGGSWVSVGIETGLWVWLGFGVTTIFAHGIFEPRDRSVLFIHAGNRLATLLAMGAILGAFMK